MNPPDRICSRCIMDTTDQDIEFDENGYCNHCRSYYRHIEDLERKGTYAPEKLSRIVEIIKEKGRGKEYDSILGVSGGVDSSFTAYYAHKLGLRPLLVHFDNGWNSEVSVKNIENIGKRLQYDLITYVIDWEEFKDLQRSFFSASVVDIEMLTDHAIMATMFRLAKEKGIHYVLSGENVATEFIMPPSWLYHKKDIRNIKGIHKRFGIQKIVNFPIFGIFDLLVSRFFRNMVYVTLLNYIDYNKTEAIRILEDEIGWRYYGGKHYESVFTKFYQAHILPHKFKIDKRKAHLSNLICSGQITRDAALAELNKALYDPVELQRDKEYVLKKLDYSESEFDQLMAAPPKSHLDYPNSMWLINLGRCIKKRFET